MSATNFLQVPHEIVTKRFRETGLVVELDIPI
jgi:hypothetical protein